MNILVKSAVAVTLLMGMGAANAAVRDTTPTVGTNKVLTFDLGSDYAAGDESNSIFKALNAGTYTFSVTSAVSDYVLSLFKFNTNAALRTSTSAPLTYTLIAGGKYTLNYFSTSGVASNVSLNISAVPEPETYALMGVGLLGLLAARRRKAMAS